MPRTSRTPRRPASGASPAWIRAPIAPARSSAASSSRSRLASPAAHAIGFAVLQCLVQAFEFAQGVVLAARRGGGVTDSVEHAHEWISFVAWGLGIIRAHPVEHLLGFGFILELDQSVDAFRSDREDVWQALSAGLIVARNPNAHTTTMVRRGNVVAIVEHALAEYHADDPRPLEGGAKR